MQTQDMYAQKNIVKANMYYNSQLYAQAIEYFVKEVAANDKETKRDAMIKLAYCYKQTGQFIEAEEVYKELMKQYGKKEPIFIFEYANALRSSSKYAEAITFLNNTKKSVLMTH
jgi:tetratricopeptide (TPR) repeat protein